MQTNGNGEPKEPTQKPPSRPDTPPPGPDEIVRRGRTTPAPGPDARLTNIETPQQERGDESGENQPRAAASAAPVSRGSCMASSPIVRLR